MTVEDLCMQLGIDFVERDLQVYDVINAEEAMLPTSPYCLAPVVRINGIPIADGRPGPVFAQLMKAWSELVGMDVLKQIQTVRFE
jgi:branched-subunit amino acid aminotransferase/4-amino-4-deoxychorismate lyase